MTSASPDDKTGGFATQRNRDGGITFDRFVRCCVSVKSLTDGFRRADTDNDGWVQMSYVQFLEMVLSVSLFPRLTRSRWIAHFIRTQAP